MSDTTNLSVKVMSVFPTASGNNGTRTRATVAPTGKKTSIGVGSKNGSSVDNRIEYQLQIKSRCMIGVHPFTGLDYWTEIFSFFGQVCVCIFTKKPTFLQSTSSYLATICMITIITIAYCSVLAICIHKYILKNS